MHLSFLGKSYEVHTPAIEVTATEETATFMGKPYVRKQYQVEQPQSAPAELTFMGQRYVRAETTEPEAYKPRPGERVMDGRQLLQLSRSRATGRHPAFRGS